MSPESVSRLGELCEDDVHPACESPIRQARRRVDAHQCGADTRPRRRLRNRNSRERAQAKNRSGSEVFNEASPQASARRISGQKIPPATEVSGHRMYWLDDKGVRSGREYPTVDIPVGTCEDDPTARLETGQLLRHSQSGKQMPAGTTTGEDVYGFRHNYRTRFPGSPLHCRGMMSHRILTSPCSARGFKKRRIFPANLLILLTPSPPTSAAANSRRQRRTEATLRSAGPAIH